MVGCIMKLNGLKNMNFYKIKSDGFAPAYEYDEFMEALHTAFPFKTNMQIIPIQEMKNIFKTSRNGRHYSKSKKKEKRQIPYTSRVLGIF